MKIKQMIEGIEEIIYSTKNGVPHDLHFKPCGKLSGEEKEKLQESLNEHFKIWSQTWVLPKLECLKTILENELVKKRKTKKVI